MAKKVTVDELTLKRFLENDVAERAADYILAGEEAQTFASALGPDAQWFWAGWTECARAFAYAVSQSTLAGIAGEVPGGTE